MVAIPTVGDDQMQSLRESITRAAGRKAALAECHPPRRFRWLVPAWRATRLISTGSAQLLPPSWSITWGHLTSRSAPTVCSACPHWFKHLQR